MAPRACPGQVPAGCSNNRWGTQREHVGGAATTAKPWRDTTGGVQPHRVSCPRFRALLRQSATLLTYGAWGCGKSTAAGTADPTQVSLFMNQGTGLLATAVHTLFRQYPHATMELEACEVLSEDVRDLLENGAAGVPYTAADKALPAWSRRTALTTHVARSAPDVLLALKVRELTSGHLAT
jgi:hypothetical protein